jgi:hypothetical protein
MPDDNGAVADGFRRRHAREHQLRAQQSISARQMRWISIVLSSSST